MSPLDLSWSSYIKRKPMIDQAKLEVAKRTIFSPEQQGDERLICFTGAGGTGKTSVLRELETLFAAHGVATITFPSVVRGFYATKGLKDQADYFAQPPEIRRSFQIELLDYYMSTLRTCLAEHPDRIILSDRSPFCHNAYAIEGIEDITLAEYREYWARVCEFAQQHIAIGVFFPYPQPWSPEVEGDPFRLKAPHHFLSIDGLMYRGFMREENDFDRLVLPETETPRERAERIVARYFGVDEDPE